MKRFTTSFFLAALFFWTLWILVLLFLSPSSWQNYFFFFLTLTGGLAFGLALLLYFLTIFFTDADFPRNALRESLRRSFLISLCVCGLLLLKLLNLISLFNIGLLVSTVILLEVYFSQ